MNTFLQSFSHLTHGSNMENKATSSLVTLIPLSRMLIALGPSQERSKNFDSISIDFLDPISRKKNYLNPEKDD